MSQVFLVSDKNDFVDCDTAANGAEHIGFDSPFVWNTAELDYPVCILLPYALLETATTAGL